MNSPSKNKVVNVYGMTCLNQEAPRALFAIALEYLTIM